MTHYWIHTAIFALSSFGRGYLPQAQHKAQQSGCDSVRSGATWCDEGRAAQQTTKRPKPKRGASLCEICRVFTGNSKMGPLGLEPTAEFYPTEVAASTSVICPACGAARALHFSRSGWLNLASIDPDLLSVVLAWERISSPIRNAIVGFATS